MEKDIRLKKEDLDSMVEKAAEKAVGDSAEKMAASVKGQIDNALKEALEPIESKLKGLEVRENELEGSNGFKSFGEYCKANFDFYTSHGTKTDNRLLRDKAAGDGIVDSEGGASGLLVPRAFSTNLLEKALQEDESFMGRCDNIPITGNSIDLPIIKDSDRSAGLVHGGIKWYWTSELEGLTATKHELYEISLKLNKLTGMYYASSEIMADSAVTVEAIMNRGFNAGFVSATNEAILNGTGAGQPRGIMSAPCLISVSAETGQDTTTPYMYENILKMIARSSAYGKSVWLASPDSLPYLATMGLAIGTAGSAVYVPANQNAAFDSLMGRPVIYNDFTAAVNTTGDLMLVDFSDYLVATKAGAGSGIQYATSIHLKFDYDQSAFRFTFRMDGQSWRDTAFTPWNGGSSRSPFVTLATRT